MAGIKWNRKGFTLMEVMVSIALIGILFVPMISFFSSSTQTNIRVKNLQRANTVAQSVMEEFRSYATIQDIAQAYWTDDGTTDTKFMTNNSYAKNTRPSTILDANGKFSEDTKYYFLEEGLESDGKEFVAHVEVDPSEYQTLNDKEISVISSLGSETTVVAKEEDETMDKIREYQRLHFNATGVNEDVSDIAKLLKKTMKVVISDTVTTTDASGNTVTQPVAAGMVHVRVYSEYDLTSSLAGCAGAQVGRDIYEGLMEESQLEGIYVFYNFDITNGTQNIMQGMEVSVDFQQSHSGWKCGYTVYAVCQSVKEIDKDTVKTGTEMQTYMNTYSPTVSLVSKANVNGNSYSYPSEMIADIWTNMPCGTSGTTYTQHKLEDIVATEKIQRLSKLTVEIYDKKDMSRPIITMTSTRGE